jgi:hypothetical protein
METTHVLIVALVVHLIFTCVGVIMLVFVRLRPVRRRRTRKPAASCLDLMLRSEHESDSGSRGSDELSDTVSHSHGDVVRGLRRSNRRISVRSRRSDTGGDASQKWYPHPRTTDIGAQSGPPHACPPPPPHPVASSSPQWQAPPTATPSMPSQQFAQQAPLYETRSVAPPQQESMPNFSTCPPSLEMIPMLQPPFSDKECQEFESVPQLRLFGAQRGGAQLKFPKEWKHRAPL